MCRLTVGLLLGAWSFSGRKGQRDQEEVLPAGEKVSPRHESGERAELLDPRVQQRPWHCLTEDVPQNAVGASRRCQCECKLCSGAAALGGRCAAGDEVAPSALPWLPAC